MSFRLSIASGKGGTGKTTVAVNLFHFLHQQFKDTLLVDCDVEEPNDSIFFPDYDKEKVQDIHQLIPRIDNTACVYCRKCVEYCEFNAIVVIPHVSFAEVNQSLCHSCGACMVACEYNAITEEPVSVGKVNYFANSNGPELLEGKLRIGSAMQTLLIKELKKEVNKLPVALQILDAPPGTSCPVVETINDSDYVILVTEPTPFGLHDLKLMVALLQDLSRPFGVIINKSGLGDNSVYKYLIENNIELLGELPFSTEYAASYSCGQLFDSIPDEISAAYKNILSKIKSKITI